MLTTEYAQHVAYYDEQVDRLKSLKVRHELFKKSEGSKLHQWQLDVLGLLFHQDGRKILWIVDYAGNCGKSYLCHILENLYNYQVCTIHMCILLLNIYLQ